MKKSTYIKTIQDYREDKIKLKQLANDFNFSNSTELNGRFLEKILPLWLSLDTFLAEDKEDKNFIVKEILPLLEKEIDQYFPSFDFEFSSYPFLVFTDETFLEEKSKLSSKGFLIEGNDSFVSKNLLVHLNSEPLFENSELLIPRTNLSLLNSYLFFGLEYDFILKLSKREIEYFLLKNEESYSLYLDIEEDKVILL